MITENILYNCIGRNIKKRRKELGITQEELARITNYSLSFIANIESKTLQTFSISALNNIAHALGVDMISLLPNELDLQPCLVYQCSNCQYKAIMPKEITDIINVIQANSKNSLIITCPNCQKKIM